MTDTAAEPAPKPARVSDFGATIGRRVLRLQAGIGRDDPQVRATLARLRSSVQRAPGSVPDIWELTVAGLPGNNPVSDDPTPHERAAHAALTLYALHQQSRSEEMHVRGGPGFGQAVRRLANGNAAKAVRRRFDAAATATSFEESLHHLRGLVGQLRSQKIQLDYAQLADDLLQLQQDRRGAETVRRRWGRQYHWTERHSIDQDDPGAAGTQEETE